MKELVFILLALSLLFSSGCGVVLREVRREVEATLRSANTSRSEARPTPPPETVGRVTPLPTRGNGNGVDGVDVSGSGAADEHERALAGEAAAAPRRRGPVHVPSTEFPASARMVDRFCPDVAPFSPNDLPKVWAIFLNGQDLGRLVTRVVYREHSRYGHVFQERVVDDGGGVAAVAQSIFARDYVCHSDVLYVIDDGVPKPYLVDYEVLLSLGSIVGNDECEYQEVVAMNTPVGVTLRDVVKLNCGRVRIYYAKHVGMVRIEGDTKNGKLDLVFERYAVN